jgi:hypothetical protein
MLGWMVQDKGVAPHVPVRDKSEYKNGTLSSSELIWDEQANEYRYPQGQALLSHRPQFTTPRNRITKAGAILYSASQHVCTGCPLKQQCSAKMPNRRIIRSVHERSREAAREIANTPQYKHRDVIERRLRCCSRISNASSTGSIAPEGSGRRS